MELSDPVGRRLTLRDLRVLMVVAQVGSMSKAAQALNSTQPAVSRSIAELEHTLGVRLLNRSRRGVEPTKYGRALLDCGSAVFDELHQGLKNLKFLADPTVGEIRIGGNESIIGGLLPAVFDRLRRQYPGITMQVTSVAAVSQQYRELRERKVDLILGRIELPTETDVDLEILFREHTFVVAGLKNRWSHRRKIEWADLVDEPWVLPSPDSLVGSVFDRGFRKTGMPHPRKGVAIGSIHLHIALVASNQFLAIVPGSILRFSAQRFALKVLPVKSPIPPSPVGIMTLKNRTPNPVTRLFIECAREVVKQWVKQQQERPVCRRSAPLMVMESKRAFGAAQRTTIIDSPDGSRSVTPWSSRRAILPWARPLRGLLGTRSLISSHAKEMQP
jgi:DNA-binding transcriptional LysR family regulator